VEPLQERTGKTLEHTDIGNNFLNGTLITWQLRERIDKWDGGIKIKGFCTTKENHWTEEIDYRMGENLCQLYI
jgi:hypothetical protein